MNIFQTRFIWRNGGPVVKSQAFVPYSGRVAAIAVGLFLCLTAGVALAQEAGEDTPASPAPAEEIAPAPTTPAPTAPVEPEAESPATQVEPAQPEDAQEAAPSTAEDPAPATEEVAPAPSLEEAAPPVLLEDAGEDAFEQDAVGDGAAAEAAPNPVLPHDLSPWGMFMAADWVVKAVMIGLAFASLVTWTVWIAKSLEIAGARTRAARVLRVISGARRLDDAAGELRRRKGPGALLVRAAEEEMRLSADALDHAGSEGLKERVAARLSRIQAQAGRRLGRGTGLLATIGSTAPFVGLFGTVWGIMNSFIGISEAQTTNLAVVAPGIAEALLATALGLVAAIPAVVFYNMFARSITGYRQMLADAAAGVELLVSRDLDYRNVPATSGDSPAKEA